MEDRIVNALLEIKADIGEVKKAQLDLKDGQNRLEGKIYKLEDNVSDLRNDMSEIKTTVNALADALLTTSKEVRKLKNQK